MITDLCNLPYLKQNLYAVFMFTCNASRQDMSMYSTTENVTHQIIWYIHYVLTFVMCFSNRKDEEKMNRVCKYMLKFFILSKNEMTILTPILNMRICVNLLKG